MPTDPLTLLETLLKTGKVEIHEGVSILSEKQLIKSSVYLKDGEVVIEFDAPFLYLHVDKLGPKKLVNLVKPRIETIVIKEKSIAVTLSTIGTWEFDR